MSRGNNGAIFSGKLLLAVIGFALGAFALSLYLMGREDYGADRYGASTYSTSALGYAGIAQVLQQLGIPVIKSRRNPGTQAQGGVLIIAEPSMPLLPQLGVPVLPDAETTLLILPKWQGAGKGVKDGWIAQAVPVFGADRILALAVEAATIERGRTVQSWSVNEIGVAPGLSEQVQLVKSDLLQPLVASKDGVLLGALHKDNKRIWVLSDPDVIVNHALNPDGSGAAFAVALIEKLRGGSGPVVFDETVHGYMSRSAGLLRLLFEFPYGIITIQILIGAGLALWATMGRFGPPDTAPPSLGAGKAGLIGNVADLMGFAGHERLIVRRYVENTIRDTARQLHAPKTLTYPQTLEWLKRFAQKRGVTRDCTAIARLADEVSASRGRADMAKSTDAARQIYQWKQEILDGPSAYTRPH